MNFLIRVYSVDICKYLPALLITYTDQSSHCHFMVLNSDHSIQILLQFLPSVMYLVSHVTIFGFLMGNESSKLFLHG